MAQSHSHFIDPEGFYDLFNKRKKAKPHEHVVYFPEDILGINFYYKNKRNGKCIVGCLNLLMLLSQNMIPLPIRNIGVLK